MSVEGEVVVAWRPPRARPGDGDQRIVGAAGDGGATFDTLADGAPWASRAPRHGGHRLADDCADLLTIDDGRITFTNLVLTGT